MMKKTVLLQTLLVFFRKNEVNFTLHLPVALFQCFKVHVIQHLAQTLLHFDQILGLCLNTLRVVIEEHVNLGIARFRALN